MSNIYIESFYRATILQPILATDVASEASPLVVKVSKTPSLSSWLLTISPNTDNEEIVYYSAKNDTNLTVSITKRAISPSALALTLDWTDWNVPEQKKTHSILDAIRWDINNIHINQSSTFSPNTDATVSVKWVTRLSVAPVSPTEPIAVWDNDARITKQFCKLYMCDPTVPKTSFIIPFKYSSTNDSWMTVSPNVVTITQDWYYSIQWIVELRDATTQYTWWLNVYINWVWWYATHIEDVTSNIGNAWFRQTFSVSCTEYLTVWQTVSLSAFWAGWVAVACNPSSQSQHRLTVTKI